MNNDISLMVEIQKIDKELNAGEEAHKQAYIDIKATKDFFVKKQSELNALREELTAVQKRADSAELNIRSHEEKINKMKDVQKLIKTNKEYNAMQKSTRDAEALKEKSEEELLSFLTSRDDLKTRLGGVEDEIKKISESLGQMEGKYANEEKEFESVKAKLLEKRKLLAGKVKADYFKTYEVIKKSNKFPVIISVAKTGACTGCYRMLPPQQYNQLLSGAVFMQCPVCSRIIYIEQENKPE